MDNIAFGLIGIGCTFMLTGCILCFINEVV